MLFKTPLKFIELFRQFLVCCQYLPKTDKCTDNQYAGFNGARAVEYVRGHDGPVFGEGVGAILDMCTAL